MYDHLNSTQQTDEVMGKITLLDAVLFGFILLPGLSQAAESWGGAGTFAAPAWYLYTNPNGETYYTERGQTISSQQTPTPLGTTFVGDAKQVKISVDTIWEGTVLVNKNFRGSKTTLFQSAIVANSPNGPRTVVDRLKYESGTLKNFPGGFGVSDAAKWVNRGIESTALVAVDQTHGSLNTSAFVDNANPLPPPGIIDVPVEVVLFIFNFNLAGNGSWDYDYHREDLGNNTHLFENGSFVNMPGLGGTRINFGMGLWHTVTDYFKNGIGVDWIYEQLDAYDFVNGCLGHPSQYSYFFQQWTTNYIFEIWPQA
jgi:hypothetical protein